MTDPTIDKAALEAARVLVAKLEAVHSDPMYRAVWEMNQARTSRPYSGLTYTAELDALKSALAALPPTTDGVRVTVRELIWHPIVLGSTSSVADASFGEYTVEHYTEAATGDGWLAIYEDNRKLGYFGTEAAAKAAAQADYAARIMSAVVVTHPAPVAAQPAEGPRIKPQIISDLREWAEFEQDGGNVEQGAAIDIILDWYDRQIATVPTTSPLAPEGVRDDVLATAARELIASRFDTYRAGNNRQVGIQDDNGEKCWIVPFDEMAALEAALKGNRT